MRIPGATYRLQFTPDFGFAQAQAVIDYLRDLGITDIYASPIFHARPGSQHGYDVVDPNRLNPELGTVEEFEALVASAQRRRARLAARHRAQSHGLRFAEPAAHGRA